MEPVKTTCPYCGVGCGVLAFADGTIKGDPDHPANFGRLCSKGSALGETIDLEGRLLAPKVDGQDTSWDTALDLVAQKFQTAIQEHGPDSVAIYGSGQLLTEDYYVANKLMKGFIGSANIDTNSRLCMASTVAGQKRAFGSDTVPGTYEDLELADLVVLVGSNLAWCHPVLFQRLEAAKQARPKMRVVVVDPRQTATCDIADQHLAIKPGTDVALFNAVLSRVAKLGAVNGDFAKSVSGLEAALEVALEGDPLVTGLSPQELNAFCDDWARTERVVTVFSQGVNQAEDGTDKVNAILNCHLATGRIGKPGMGPFSVTGQPNAMGGREVGGLANMLAAHLDLENPEHREAVRAFWNARRIAQTAGLKAVDLFEAVRQGQIKALWIMSTNPVVSMPEANRVREALEICPFVVVSDIIEQTDTANMADVLLPAAGWGEKSGTVTNSDRTISRQRSFLPTPAQARPDWQIICDVAQRMGWAEAFSYDNAHEIFREHAALSGVAAGLGRDFDISGAADLSAQAYEDWKPTRWPISKGKTAERFFADGAFFAPDGLARAIAVRQMPLPMHNETYPLRINTGRVRDHWHTMTRSAKSARLSNHLAEPFVEIHPKDARERGLKAADLATLKTQDGTVVLRVLVTERTPQGSVFVPMHWTAQYASNGRIDGAVRANVDPTSGQPALKSSFGQIAPFKAAWYGFALSVSPLAPETEYWALAKRETGHSAELAGLSGVSDWNIFAQELFGQKGAALSGVISQDQTQARILLSVEGVLTGALFVSNTPVEVARRYAVDQLGQPLDIGLLAGRPPLDQPDQGATICSCFNVGLNTIREAIALQDLCDIDAIGAALQAGTNCGSCRPELRAILQAATVKVAAQ